MTTIRVGVWVALFLCGVAAWAQTTPANDSPIQDNSFLLEEAYNQEKGVVQHISTFMRLWNSKSWAYSFTQEWPAPKNWRHQLSYTIPIVHGGEGLGTGIGDVALNYRYQLVGDGDARVAVAPRASLLLPTGNSKYGRGSGGAGVQIDIPASIVLQQKWVTHWNAGFTVVPSAKDSLGETAATAGYNLGGSIIYLLNNRFNLMLETAHSRYQYVASPSRTEWTDTTYISPGVRWAYNYKSGLQIVPGFAVPIGVAGASGERGLFFYLSFEHPFTRN